MRTLGVYATVGYLGFVRSIRSPRAFVVVRNHATSGIAERFRQVKAAWKVVVLPEIILFIFSSEKIENSRAVKALFICFEA